MDTKELKLKTEGIPKEKKEKLIETLSKTMDKMNDFFCETHDTPIQGILRNSWIDFFDLREILKNQIK